MFILRRVTSEKLEINTILNEEYSLALKGKNDIEIAERTESWESSLVAEIYGLIIYNEGRSVMPLYKKSTYYIMTGDGKTFERL